MSPLTLSALFELLGYLQRTPQAEADLRPLVDQLSASGDLFDRKNLSGHITASVLVLDAAREQALLVRHNATGFWLQPGGHVDASEDRSLWDAALRETLEEAGVRGVKCLDELADPDGAPVVFDIAQIAVPPSRSKEEGAHRHFDYLFVGQLAHTAPLVLALSEVGDAKWWELAQIEALPGTRLPRVIRKLRQSGLVGSLPA